MLPASAFSWTLGAAPGDGAGDREGEKGFDPTAPRWAVWGRGDFGSFSGRPDEITSYKGETRTGWLGVDAREAPRGSGSGSGSETRPGRWVAGLAVSRGTSETDYTLDGEQGRIETGLTALWPYGRWTFANGLELRGMLGAGRGEARHETDDGIEEKSRLSMWTGSAGLRRPLPPVAGIDLAARGDASLARMQTAKGDGDEEQAIDGILADVWRLRGGIEASRRIGFDDGSTLTPFVETAARRDGGDGVTGTGLEVAGGVRVAAPAPSGGGARALARGALGEGRRGAGREPDRAARSRGARAGPVGGALTPLGRAGGRVRRPVAGGAATGRRGRAREVRRAAGTRLRLRPQRRPLHRHAELRGLGRRRAGGRVGWRLTPAAGLFRVTSTHAESANAMSRPGACGRRQAATIPPP